MELAELRKELGRLREVESEVEHHRSRARDAEAAAAASKGSGGGLWGYIAGSDRS